MKEIVVKFNQNLTDIAVQYYGSIEGVVQLVVDNNDKITSIDDRIEAGLVLKIDESKIINVGIVNYYVAKKIDVGTGADLVPFKSYNRSFSKAFH